MRDLLAGLRANIPIYATRPTAQGYVGSFALSGWLVMIALYLGVANTILWGAYGVVRAVGLIV